MPVVDITMIRGRSTQQVRAIADIAHRTLADTYEVPAGDRFQVIHQVEPHELIFDEQFGGGPRTRDFILVKVTGGRPRSVEVKRRFCATLVERLLAQAALDPENVFIMLDNVELSDLSLGGGRPFDLQAVHVD